MKREDIIIAGFGGQGVIFASKVAIWAGLFDGKNVAQKPSYGPEMRGGTANGTTIISDEEIYSPVFKHPSSIIVMNEPSLKKFVEDYPNDLSIEKDGLAVVNSSIVKRKCKRKDVQVVKVKANEIAEKIGAPRAANMVILGAYFAKRNILKWESVLKGLEGYLSSVGKNKFFDINKKALEAGANSVSKLRD